MDGRLWSFRGEAFIPHSLAEEDAEAPVALGLGETPGNHRDLLINLTLEAPGFVANFRGWPNWWSRSQRSARRHGINSASTGSRAILYRTIACRVSEVHDHGQPQTDTTPERLLDDLESIHDLLYERNEPPLLTESFEPDNIPLLSDVVSPVPPRARQSRRPRQPPRRGWRPPNRSAWTTSCERPPN